MLSEQSLVAPGAQIAYAPQVHKLADSSYSRSPHPAPAAVAPLSAIGWSAEEGLGSAVSAGLDANALAAAAQQLGTVVGSHGTIPTAVALPNVPLARLVDTLKPTDKLDLYRLDIGPDTAGFYIIVRALQPADALPGRVWLLDSAGALRGDWHLAAGTPEVGVELSAAGQSSQPFLVFGVSHGDLESPEPSTFEVIVVREPGASSAPGADASAPAAQSSVPVAIPPGGAGISAALSSLAASAPLAMSTALVSSSALSPQPVALANSINFRPGPLLAAPLPTRSAAPSGGVLADGSPARPVDRLDAALVDLSLVEIAPQRPRRTVWEEPSEPPGGPRAGRPDSTSLVALQGAGGFPILAAAHMDRNRPLGDTAPAPVVLLPRLEGAEPSAAQARASTDPTGPIALPLPAATESSAVTPVQQQKVRAARNEASSGVHVALTLALGLLLPDLLSVLQAAPSRRRLRSVLLRRLMKARRRARRRRA